MLWVYVHIISEIFSDLSEAHTSTSDRNKNLGIYN